MPNGIQVGPIGDRTAISSKTSASLDNNPNINRAPAAKRKSNKKDNAQSNR